MEDPDAKVYVIYENEFNQDNIIKVVHTNEQDADNYVQGLKRNNNSRNNRNFKCVTFNLTLIR